GLFGRRVNRALIRTIWAGLLFWGVFFSAACGEPEQECSGAACANPEVCVADSDCIESTYCGPDFSCIPDPCNDFSCERGQCVRGTQTCESKPTCTEATQLEDC